MDRNIFPSQNEREKVLRERGSVVKDYNCIRELETKAYKVFETSLVPFSISHSLTQVPSSCVPLSLRSLLSPTDQIFPPARLTSFSARACQS